MSQLPALDLLYPKVVKGGAIIFDEYGLMPWEGESIAVEEYFDQMDSRSVLKISFAIQPHGYFINERGFRTDSNVSREELKVEIN